MSFGSDTYWALHINTFVKHGLVADAWDNSLHKNLHTWPLQFQAWHPPKYLSCYKISMNYSFIPLPDSLWIYTQNTKISLELMKKKYAMFFAFVKKTTSSAIRVMFRNGSLYILDIDHTLLIPSVYLGTCIPQTCSYHQILFYRHKTNLLLLRDNYCKFCKQSIYLFRYITTKVAQPYLCSKCEQLKIVNC